MIDGEAVACGEDDIANFDRIRHEHHDGCVFLYAFKAVQNFAQAVLSLSLDQPVPIWHGRSTNTLVGMGMASIGLGDLIDDSLCPGRPR